MTNLLEITEKERLSREDAAARLHALADALARHNDVEFDRGGLHFKVHVPDEVEFKLEIEFEEDDNQTKAALLLRLPDGVELRGRGHAMRNPADAPQPRIGEEIAAARALSDLTHQLLDKAAGEISEITHRPATITA